MLERTSKTQWIGAASIFAAGLLVGIIVGRALPSSRAFEREADREGASVKTAPGRTDSAADGKREDAAKLVLGNIMTVPFQELYNVLASRPESELQDLARQLNEQPISRENSQRITTFFKAWSHLDPVAALAAATRFSTAERRGTAISAVLEGADSTAAEALAKTIVALPVDAVPPHTQRNFVGVATTKWSELDPAAAAAFMDTVPAPPGSMFPDSHQIAMNWAAVDPQAALAWAQQHDLNSTFQTHFATSGAINGWWQKEPGAAEAYVASHMSTLEDRQIASTLVSQIFNSDPKRAVDFVNQLPDVEARRQADSMIAIQLGWTDPKGAAVWASNLPDDVRAIALNSSVEHWAQSDAAAAGQWLNSLNGTTRDQAVSGYSSAVSRTDPANALGWAATISDARVRENSLDRIARSWMSRSPTEAKVWVQGSALSDEQKKRLIASVPPPGG